MKNPTTTVRLKLANREVAKNCFHIKIGQENVQFVKKKKLHGFPTLHIVNLNTYWRLFVFNVQTFCISFEAKYVKSKTTMHFNHSEHKLLNKKMHITM